MHKFDNFEYLHVKYRPEMNKSWIFCGLISSFTFVLLGYNYFSSSLSHDLSSNNIGGGGDGKLIMRFDHDDISSPLHPNNNLSSSHEVSSTTNLIVVFSSILLIITSTLLLHIGFWMREMRYEMVGEMVGEMNEMVSKR